MRDRDESKLPKWAQDKLSAYRRTIKAQQGEIQRLQGDSPPTRWAVHDLLAGTDRFLGEGARIRFWPNESRNPYIDVAPNERNRFMPNENSLTIRGVNSRLAVQPLAVNAIEVRII